MSQQLATMDEKHQRSLQLLGLRTKELHPWTESPKLLSLLVSHIKLQWVTPKRCSYSGAVENRLKSMLAIPIIGDLHCGQNLTTCSLSMLTLSKQLLWGLKEKLLGQGGGFLWACISLEVGGSSNGQREQHAAAFRCSSDQQHPMIDHNNLVLLLCPIDGSSKQFDSLFWKTNKTFFWKKELASLHCPF